MTSRHVCVGKKSWTQLPEYTVTIGRSARKELERLDAATVAKIFQRIENLAEAPRPHGCAKLSGTDDLWRIRIGDYRVIYSTDDERLLVGVLTVRHRKDAYR